MTPPQLTSSPLPSPPLSQPSAAPELKVVPTEPSPVDLHRGPTISAGSLEEDVTTWIELVSGEEHGGHAFSEWLKDGQVLCKTANKISPGVVPRINTSSTPFKEMENITNFIQACRKLGVREENVFSTFDLHEAKNLRTAQL